MTTTRRTVRAAGVTLLTLVLITLSAGLAIAGSRHFTDPNDARGIDIRSVGVQYAHWLRVKASYDGRIRVGQTYAIWIDTNPRNRGPEFYFGNIPWSEVGSLQRVSGFGDKTKTLTTCAKVDGGVNEQTRTIGWAVAGTCLGNPKRVRIAVQFLRPNGSTSDWAPGFRRLYPWVHRY